MNTVLAALDDPAQVRQIETTRQRLLELDGLETPTQTIGRVAADLDGAGLIWRHSRWRCCG